MSLGSTQLVYVADHRDRALHTLLSQWHGSPRILALVKAIAVGVQELEDVGFDLLVSTTLQAAAGANLDLWGQLVGQGRMGLTDDEYRTFIEVRIFANNAWGTTEDLIHILQVSTSPSVVRHGDMFPAGAQFLVYRQSWMSGPRFRAVQRLLASVQPAGVAIYAVEYIPGFFGFAEAGEEGLDDGLLARMILPA